MAVKSSSPPGAYFVSRLFEGQGVGGGGGGGGLTYQNKKNQ